MKISDNKEEVAAEVGGKERGRKISRRNSRSRSNINRKSKGGVEARAEPPPPLNHTGVAARRD